LMMKKKKKKGEDKNKYIGGWPPALQEMFRLDFIRAEVWLCVLCVCVCVCLGMWLTIYTCSALVMLAHHKKIFQIDGSCQFGRNERG
jgi:hypothetical protein